MPGFLSITNSWCLLKLMSIKSVMNSPGKNTGLTFPPPGDLSNTGIKPRFPALQVDSLPAEPPGKTNSRQVRAISSVQFRSVAQSCPILCDPMDCNTPGLPVHHQLPEFTQTHVHRISDAIQTSHPLSSASPPVPNPSQHQSLFQ